VRSPFALMWRLYIGSIGAETRACKVREAEGAQSRVLHRSRFTPEISQSTRKKTRVCNVGHVLHARSVVVTD